MAAGACNDDPLFFFEDEAGGTEFGWEITGAPGEFATTVKTRIGNTGVVTQVGNSGKEMFPVGKANVLTAVIFFAKTGEVKVEAGLANQKYCRTVKGQAEDTKRVALTVRLV